MAADLSRLAEPVEHLRVLHQDAVAGGRVGNPLGQEIEQHRVVWLLLLGRMRLVAAPTERAWLLPTLAPTVAAVGATIGSSRGVPKYRPLV